MSGFLPVLGGGGGAAAIQLAAGGLSGILAMVALIATDVIPLRGKPPPAALPIRGCLNTGSIVAVAQPGEQMLITGRSADGEFLRVYVPGPVPAGHEGWIPAGSVDLLSNGAALPVAGCGEVAADTGTPGPTATATAVVTPGPTPTATGTPNPSPTPTTKQKPTAGPTAQATLKPTTKPTATPTAAPTPNLGPVFTTNPPRADRPRLGTNPLGSGNCGVSGTIAQITTAATDPDGVAKIELWVVKPASRTPVRLGHNFSQDGATWFNFIDTAKDGITLAGTLTFWAIAFDSKGASTTSATGKLSIFRCDTEAVISGGINLLLNTNGTYRLTTCGPFVVPWRYTISDKDGLATQTITYTITHSGAPTISRSAVPLVRLARTLFWVANSPTPKNSAPYLGLNTVTYSVRTTDKFTGATQTKQRTSVVDYNSCVD